MYNPSQLPMQPFHSVLTTCQGPTSALCLSSNAETNYSRFETFCKQRTEVCLWASLMVSQTNLHWYALQQYLTLLHHGSMP